MVSVTLCPGSLKERICSEISERFGTTISLARLFEIDGKIYNYTGLDIECVPFIETAFFFLEKKEHMIFPMEKSAPNLPYGKFGKRWRKRKNQRVATQPTEYDTDEICPTLELLPIERIGLYIGKFSGDSFVLSIEGSQMIAASRNVFSAREDKVGDWMRGLDLKADDGFCIDCTPGLLIVMCGRDAAGCGKFDGKYIKNRIPRGRRLRFR